MNKIIEKYLKSISDEGVSSSAGIGFAIDDPHGFVKKVPLPDSKKNKKRKIFMDEQTSNFHHRVLIDFDGVINKYDDNWNEGKLSIENIIDNTKESIDNIRSSFDNVDIIIFTTRACKTENVDYEEQIENVKKFLKKNNIYYDGITGEKLGALIYIDDNGYHFTDWKKDLSKIKERIQKRINERESR